MTVSDKELFLRKLRGVAVDWTEVWKILCGGYPFEEHKYEGDVPTREDCFELMVQMAEEHRGRWWHLKWVTPNGEIYSRQAQVEQEFDMWFEDKCAAEGKFLPRWYVLKCSRRR